MPRPFTEAERDAIRHKLLDVARTHFARFGYRKTNVADIASEAGIAKGSFYLFFDSKAAAFMEIARIVEDEIRSAFLAESSERDDADVEARIAHLLSFHLRAMDRDPFLRIALDPKETDTLFRDIPAPDAEAHQRDDVAFFEGLLDTWASEGLEVRVDAAVLASLLRALYVVLLHRDLVGSGATDQVLRLLVDGAAGALAEP